MKANDESSSYVLHLQGSAHGVSDHEPEENEAVRLLHEAVLAVTGKPVPPPPKPRIGFLP